MHGQGKRRGEAASKSSANALVTIAGSRPVSVPAQQPPGLGITLMNDRRHAKNSKQRSVRLLSPQCSLPVAFAILRGQKHVVSQCTVTREPA